MQDLEMKDQPVFYTWFFHADDGCPQFVGTFNQLMEGDLVELTEYHGGRMYEFESLMMFLTPFLEDTSVYTHGEDDCFTEYKITNGKLSITFTEIEDIEEIEVEEYDADVHDAPCEECEENAATHDGKCYDCALEVTSGREVQYMYSSLLKFADFFPLNSLTHETLLNNHSLPFIYNT